MKTRTKVFLILLAAYGLAFVMFGVNIIVFTRAHDSVFFLTPKLSSFNNIEGRLVMLGLLLLAVGVAFCAFFMRLNGWIRALSVVLIVLLLFAGVVDMLRMTVDRRLYHEYSPDGERRILIVNWQFLVAGGADVYVRIGNCQFRKLACDENDRIDWVYDDYTVEWSDTGFALRPSGIAEQHFFTYPKPSTSR